MNIELFTLAPHNEIIKLYTDVFSHSEGQSEGHVIGELVNNLLKSAPNLIGFLAKENDVLLGCVLFSPVSFKEKSDFNAYILSPMAVATSHQKMGIGSQLINHGINHLKCLDVDFVITYGDPNYYGRLGFKPLDEQQLKAPFPLSFAHGWQAYPLGDAKLTQLKGQIECVPPLNKAQYW